MHHDSSEPLFGPKSNITVILSSNYRGELEFERSLCQGRQSREPGYESSTAVASTSDEYSRRPTSPALTLRQVSDFSFARRNLIV